MLLDLEAKLRIRLDLRWSGLIPIVFTIAEHVLL